MAISPFREAVTMGKSTGAGLGLLRGAKSLAGFIFDDKKEWRKVYPLKKQLGLFRMNGLICGRPDTIRARIAEAESVSREDADNEVA
jgi:hypothetical protein